MWKTKNIYKKSNHRIKICAFTFVMGLQFLISSYSPAIGNSHISYIKLEDLEHANPYEDIKQNIKKGDLKFVAARTRGMFVPGVPDSKKNYYEKYGYKIILGISDVVMNYEQGRLTAIAVYYAQEYNKKLLRYLLKLEGVEGEKVFGTE